MGNIAHIRDRLWRQVGALAALVISILLPLSGTAAVVSDAVQTERTSATLISEADAVAPGSTSSVALRLRLAPGWHTYWINPGDSGMPASLEWDLPPGFEVGPILWPAPAVMPYGPLVNYGYKEEVWLLSDVRVPSNYQGRTVEIAVNADWLVCKELCIPEEGRLNLSLPIASNPPAPEPSYRAKFEAARAALPSDSSEWELTAEKEPAGIRLLMPARHKTIELTSLHFFPYEEGVVEPSQVQPLHKTGGGVALSIPFSTAPERIPSALRGVLSAEYRDGSHVALHLNLPVSASPAMINGSTGTAQETDFLSGNFKSEGSSTEALTLSAAILLGLIGGLILNLMPCVFPVVSMKALAFIQETDQTRARKHGLLYGAGVLVSFWILAGALLALRSGGQELGWGFQLQSPAVLAGLAVVFFILGLSFLGFFSFGSILPSSVATASFRSPNVDHFASGGLAVLVASPCTGPFMGAALGFAVTRSNVESFAVFTALGLGMAFPYLLLSWFPVLRRSLPKPGPWMEVVRQVFAFPMFATVIWLLWVLGKQGAIESVTYVLLGLLAIGFGIWMSKGRGRTLSYLGRGFTAVSALILVVVIYTQGSAELTENSSSAGTFSNDPVWAEYSAERIKVLNAEGKTVFVDFTAAWCITCQFNKRMVLETHDVQQLFKRNDVELMRADWTQRDAVITRALESLGRSGVPVYLVQRPNASPYLLPEILTREMVRKAIEEI